MLKKLIAILYLLFVCSCFENQNQDIKTETKLNRILKFEDDSSVPVDVAFYASDIFVLDWGLKNVVKFSNVNVEKLLGDFEFIHPGAIGFAGNNLVVTDRFNRTASFFSVKGGFITELSLDNYRLNSLQVYKTNFLLRTRNYKYKNGKTLAQLIDFNGNVKQNVGEIIEVNGMLTDMVLMNEVEIAVNKNIFVSASKYHNPVIKIYDLHSGNLLRKINYDLEYNLTDYINKENKECYKNYSFLHSIDVDGKFIYAVIKRRVPNKQESQIGRFMSDKKGIYLLENKVRSSETDLNELLIFNLNGNLISRTRLEVFCDKIKVNNSRLYIIDSYVGKKIYEYNFTIK